MKLCYDDVKKWKICLPMLLYFRRNYSEPTELIDLINDKKFTIEDLELGFEHVGMQASREEIAAYNKRLNVDEQSAPSTYRSTNIVNSQVVCNSDNIKNSTNIDKCTNVEDSRYILFSEVIKNSSDIYNSKYITNSSKVLTSLNVSDSTNIVKSNYINSSHSIYDSNSINNSYNILKSNKVSDSIFCRNVNNVDHCLFCFDISDKSYHIFNQPVTEWVYNLTKDQLQNYLQYELDLMQIVRNDLLPIAPIIIESSKRFNCYPKSFVRWLTTIPLFDQAVMLNIVLNPSFFKI